MGNNLFAHVKILARTCYKTGKYLINSKALTCFRYSFHSARLFRSTNSKTSAPNVSFTNLLCSIAAIASAKSDGSGVGSEFSDNSYLPSTPARPAPIITAKARYGLHAESGERISMRVDASFFGL